MFGRQEDRYFERDKRQGRILQSAALSSLANGIIAVRGLNYAFGIFGSLG